MRREEAAKAEAKATKAETRRDNGVAKLHREAERFIKKAEMRGPQEAAKWWGRAAELGHAQARHNLGYMFANGLGIQKNNTSMEPTN